MEKQVSLQAGTGIVYGLYQFSTDLARGFVDWLHSIDHPYGRCLSYVPGTCEFSALWLELAEQDQVEFSELQTRFYEQVMQA
ncbi:hypothetical protein [Azotosporobacter soli]|uniref:hypothetical protein n=1 Tax=Azotosporobacter soli TaxID=3055040 RepID=UPI0031FF1652